MSHELVGAALPSEGGCSFTLRVGVLPRLMLLQLVILRAMLALQDHFLDFHKCGSLRTIASTGIGASMIPWPVTDGSHVQFPIKPT